MDKTHILNISVTISPKKGGGSTEYNPREIYFNADEEENCLEEYQNLKFELEKCLFSLQEDILENSQWRLGLKK